MHHDWSSRFHARRALSEALLEARRRADSRAGLVLEQLTERYLNLTTEPDVTSEEFFNIAAAASSVRQQIGAEMWRRA